MLEATEEGLLQEGVWKRHLIWAHEIHGVGGEDAVLPAEGQKHEESVAWGLVPLEVSVQMVCMVVLVRSIHTLCPGSLSSSGRRRYYQEQRSMGRQGNTRGSTNGQLVAEFRANMYGHRLTSVLAENVPVCLDFALCIAIWGSY